IIDEVHAFAGDDRGAHMMALIERLTQYASADFQRLGLSATVGNPETLLEWLTGSSRREGRILRPESTATARALEFHAVATDQDPALTVRALVRNKKSLETRSLEPDRPSEAPAPRTFRQWPIDTWLATASGAVRLQGQRTRRTSPGGSGLRCAASRTARRGWPLPGRQGPS
ncbi:MAG: hypothetical protein ACYCW6_32430, partial [Candidatus Xenobia bacterium]